MKNAINKQFLKAFLLTAIVGAIVNLVVDVYTSPKFSAFIMADVVACLSPVIGYIIFKIYRSEKLVMAFMSLILVPAMVYQFLVTSGYLNGIHVTVITVLGYMCSLILKSRIRIVFHCLLFLTLLVLAIYQCVYLDNFNYEANQSVGKVIGSAVPFLAIYFIVTISAGLLKDKYDQSNSKLTFRNFEINKRNKKIAKQNDDLHSQKEELNVLNNHLEEQVRARTENIKIKNEQLAAYSFRNAHNVRGSLARILGLIYLNNQDSDISKDELLKLIEVEAKEMDTTLRQISNDLFIELDR